MKKTISIVSIVVIIAVILALIFVGVLFWAAKSVNTNELKDKITQMTYEKTGRQLTINGSLDWSFFPWLGVKAHEVSLNNAAVFKKTGFAKMDELDIKIKTLPLIFGKFYADKIILKNLSLNLIRVNDNENNWQDLLALSQGSKAGAVAPLAISDVEISGANVNYTDQEAEQSASISNLSFLAKNINVDGTPFYVSLKSDLKMVNPDFASNFALSGNVVINFNKQFYAVRDLQLKGYVSGELLVQVPFSASANIAADLPNQAMNIDNLKASFSSVNAEGSVKVSNIFYAPNVVGKLEAASFDPKPLLQAFGWLPKNVAPNSPIFKNAGFAVSLQTTSKFLKIPTLKVNLDDTIISGQANYSHFGDKLVAFNLGVNKIDLDSYLAAFLQVNSGKKTSSHVKNKEQLSDKSKAHDKIKIAAESLNPLINGFRLVKMDGDLQIGSLKFNKMNYENLTTVVSSDLGLIEFSPLDFTWYQGKAHGKLDVDVRKIQTQFYGNVSATNAKVQPLLMDLIGSDKISGLLSFNSSFATRGNDAKSMLNNLNGAGNLKLAKGIFNGVDIRYQISKAASLLNKKSQPIKESSPPKTDFGQMTDTFIIKNGAFFTKDLLVLADDFKANGQGSADLTKGTMDFLLQARGNRTKFTVPIKVTGTFLNPSIEPDLSLLVGSIIENKVTNELGNSGIKVETSGTNGQGIKIKSIKLDKKLKDILPF